MKEHENQNPESYRSSEALKSRAEKVKAAIEEARSNGISVYYDGPDPKEMVKMDRSEGLSWAMDTAAETADIVAAETGMSFESMKHDGLGQLRGQLHPHEATIPGEISGFVIGNNAGLIEISRNKKDYESFKVYPGQVVLIAESETLDGLWMRGLGYDGEPLEGYHIRSDATDAKYMHSSPYDKEVQKRERIEDRKRRKRTAAMGRRAAKANRWQFPA